MEPELVRALSTMPKDGSPIAILVSRLGSTRVVCRQDCRGVYHTRHNVQALPILERIVGRLFLGYSGSSIYQQQCDVTTCRQRGIASTQLTYFFPELYVDKAVSVTVINSMFSTPSLNLKIRKSASETNRLFALSRCEGVDSIRELFERREASPDDVDHRRGWTPLHVRDSTAAKINKA